MVRGSNPGGVEIFRTRPGRYWGPSNLLHNGYRVYPGVRRPGRGAGHPLPPSAEVKERVELLPPLPFWALVACSTLIFTYLHNNYFNSTIKWTFVMEKQCAFCKAGTGFVYNILTSGWSRRPPTAEARLDLRSVRFLYGLTWGRAHIGNWTRFSPPVLPFSSVIIIPPMLHIHLHPTTNTTFYQKEKRAKPGNLNKIFFQMSSGIGQTRTQTHVL